MTTLLQSVLAISAAYLLHEVAHAAMGEFLGLRVKGVECSWRGIAVRLHRGPQYEGSMCTWSGTAAINSVLITLLGGDNFAAGTTFVLYGTN